jgi:hypothetical protein
MDLSPGFFDIQLRFADSVARVTGLSFDHALLDFTNLYLRFVGPSFDRANPLWQEYLHGLYSAPDRVVWTCEFHEKTKNLEGNVYPPSPYGCFNYRYLPETNAIRYHFVNADTSGLSPLSRERMPARLGELRAMFADIRREYGARPVVRGNSWLYNIHAYARLFPPEYIRASKVLLGEYRYRYLSLWGQFLLRDGQLRQPMADTFLACPPGKESLEGLARCFPYHVLSPEGPITLLYDFYGV